MARPKKDAAPKAAKKDEIDMEQWFPSVLHSTIHPKARHVLLTVCALIFMQRHGRINLQEMMAATGLGAQIAKKYTEVALRSGYVRLVGHEEYEVSMP